MLRPYMPAWMKSDGFEFALELVFTFILSGLIARYVF